MTKMHVVVVGGFLGSGKTTLLARAAKHLSGEGKRVGIITNDQAAQLVDTQLLKSPDVTVGEVAGGCFCCRFQDLEEAANRAFKDVRPDVLLTEPVGSCTDISATVLQPIKKFWNEWADLSPFSVLADPRRLLRILDGDSSFPDGVRYIIRKQFEEADYIVINKTDSISPDELAEIRCRVSSTWDDVRIPEMSALQDRGVTDWLGAVSGVQGGGTKILDVDYDTYARGEAELGWLNTAMSLVAHEPIDWNAVALGLIRRIHSRLARIPAEIGHLKLLMTDSAGQQVSANVTSTEDGPTAQGDIGRSEGPVNLILNARAHIDPKRLSSIVEHSIADIGAEAVKPSPLTLHSFSPGYPRPSYRIDRVLQR